MTHIMELNCRIPADLDSLYAYNASHSWIPGPDNIRPTEEVLVAKRDFFNQINEFYETVSDFILEDIFKMPVEFNAVAKLKAKNVSMDNEFKFVKNKFPYNLKENVNHYIIWYSNTSSKLDDGTVNTDIHRSIFEILQHENFEYVWYENPKMNVPGLYHWQVFWKISS